jgi:1-acyl-sn-glycerol-3-phosphate acyltransferase
MIAGLMLLFTYIVLGAPSGVVLILWAFITGDVRPLYWAAITIVRIGFRLAGVRVIATGREGLPKNTACIFMANHLSNLDPPAFLPQLPGRTSAFIKRGLLKIPILGWGLRIAKFIPVDRSGNVESARESVKAAQEVIAAGIHITTFVEGTRSRDGRLLPFKKGPFYLAMETGAPCVPVSISGTETIMRKGGMKIYPGTVRIVFHTPLDPKRFESREALMLAVRSAIASGLPEWMRESLHAADAR